MDFSILLARYFGLIYFILAFAFFQKRAVIAAFIEDFLSNDLLIFAYGIGAFSLGLLVYFIHPIWVYDWPIIITLISVFWIIKGLISLFFCTYLKKCASCWMDAKLVELTSSILMILSLVLLYYGYILN